MMALIGRVLPTGHRHPRRLPVPASQDEVHYVSALSFHAIQASLRLIDAGLQPISKVYRA
jgi:hypothetical protein